jgi:2-hydroxychromene-2-carboxylate isomerase
VAHPSHRSRPELLFDLGCPFSYLAVERIERLLGEVEWVPVDASAVRVRVGVRGEEAWAQTAALRDEAERRAASLRLPLAWPQRFPAAVPRAMRAAAYAAEVGAGAQFVLAASRLAFCGGFDLEDPAILAEAAAAAGAEADACLAAARDRSRPGAPPVNARWLLGTGVRRLPALRIGERWFAGERGLLEAATLTRVLADLGRPLAPAG